MKSRLIGDNDEIKATREKLMPKKQSDHHHLQKQLDTLFPGLWLTEITPDFCCCLDGLKAVPDGLQKVFNYDAKVD
ncbi:serine/arginine repetitive matrix protein 1, partial [Tanacetum coccineum]